MEDKTFELIEKMYAEMQQGFKQTNERFDNIENRLGNVEDKLGNVENRLNGVEGEVRKLGVKVDGEVTPKIEALLDGYKQNSEQLTRIDQEVSKHEEVILRRVK